MSMKPMLFNTNMVRGLQANRKTETRRLMKGYALEHLELDTDGSIIGVYDQFEGYVRPVMDYAPYYPGDILYVRETFGTYNGDYYLYRADYPDGAKTYDFDGHKCDLPRWHPSIHMPREAARIFLRVTDVRVERLRDITDKGIVAEGICQGPYPEKGTMKWRRYQMIDYVNIWNSTIKPADRALYGWDANPWVWVIEFERVSKEAIGSV